MGTRPQIIALGLRLGIRPHGTHTRAATRNTGGRTSPPKTLPLVVLLALKRWQLVAPLAPRTPPPGLHRQLPNGHYHEPIPAPLPNAPDGHHPITATLVRHRVSTAPVIIAPVGRQGHFQHQGTVRRSSHNRSRALRAVNKIAAHSGRTLSITLERRVTI